MMKKLLLLTFIAAMLAGCELGEMTECARMCLPAPVLKYEHYSCYCDRTAQAVKKD